MKSLRYLDKYFIKYKWRLLLGIFITVLSKILALQIPKIIGKSLNVVESYMKGDILDKTIVKEQLLWNILLIVGVSIFAGFLTFVMRQMIIVTSRLIEFDLKNEIYKQYQRLSINFYKKNRTGDLMNRISEDVSKVRMYFGPAIMYSMNMIFLFIVGFTQMVKTDAILTLYTLIPFPVLSISIFYISKVINKRSTIVQEYLSKLTTYNQEFFSGVNVVKSYGIETMVIAGFDKLANKSKEKNISLYKIQALFFPLMILLIGISNLTVIYIGGKQYINGEIPIGVIAEFILYVNMLTWPVAVVGWVTSMVQQAEASQKRINAFLQQKPSIENGFSTKKITQAQLSFEKVSFTYPDTGIKALKNISFELKEGETLGIVGKTGSGKSTLLELIARLYDPTEGKIIIDNQNANTYALNNLREVIGYVPQNPFLFSESIEDNIRFGKKDASIEEIVEAAKNAAVHHNIKEFKDGYKTLLGERGVTLSGGQIQRLSIARALIKDPLILLFDDCLSAVDADTEEKILEHLNRISQDKTTCIVSHRVSSVKNADKIIVLKEGEIIQQGTHNELLKIAGHYRELSEKQSAQITQ